MLPLALAVATASAAQAALPRLDSLDGRGRVTFFIAEGSAESRYQPSDRDLTRWALAAWERNADGVLSFEPAPERDALVRIYWVPANAGQYGETRPIGVNGRRGAAIYIRPDTDALGPDIAAAARQDPLLRDAIVYLTCVHEIGHALGLGHTANDADIMYFFGYGGDILGFFQRYRRQLGSRTDIQKVSGLSPTDIARLRTLFRR
jgi:hypothetical protein